ncbi:MAG: tetratricopeptide repeat protein [candidate division WOR-3 bacterium]
MFDIFAGKDPQKALQRAHELIKEGRSTQAIRVLQDNLTQGEESFDLYLELARLYFENEQRPEAVETLRNCYSFFPNRVDEIIGLLSDYFYRYTSIDAGDFLIQLYTREGQYDEVAKVLRAFNEREIKLLTNKYEKLKQGLGEKKVLSKRDLEIIIILGTINFLYREPQSAIEAVESVVEIDTFQKELIAWARTISRERFNDPYPALLLLRLLIASKNFTEALTQAQRIYEKFPDFLDPLIEMVSKAQPPRELESNFSEFLTELYVKKGDLDASLARLQLILKNEPSRIDEVIKTLRELQRINPKNLKVLYILGDTLLNSGRVSLAISEYEKILEMDSGEAEKLIQRYRRAFEKEPNNPLVIQSLVNLYLKQNKLDDAVALIERAYNFDPGLLDEYILNLNAILEKDPGNFGALKILGLCLAHKGDDENAGLIIENLMENGKNEIVGEMLDEIIKKKPKDNIYVNLKAKNLIALDRIGEAFSLIAPNLDDDLNKTIIFVPTLDAIVNKKPEYAPQILNFYKTKENEAPDIFGVALARAYAYVGDYEGSIKKFDECFSKLEHKDAVKRALIEVLKERPKAVPLLLSAARIFMKEGEIEIATQFFKTAQMVDPKAFFEIVDEFYDTLKNFPKDKEVRILLIDTFFNRKLYDRVIEEAKKGIEVFGQNVQYFNLKLGQALVEKGNLTDGVRPLMLALDGEMDYSKEVLSYLDKILEVDKSNVPAHFARGRALARCRMIDEAVDEYLLTARIVPARAEYVLEELKNLLTKAITNPKLIYAIGNVEITLKRYEDGIRHLLQACELDSNFVSRAIPIFEKMIYEFPSPFLEFSLARLYSMANLNNSATKYFILAQEHDKKYLEPAISELKKICAEESKDTESRKGLAQIYFNYNNLEDALNLTAEIYRLNPNETDWVKSFVFNILSKNATHLPSYYFIGTVFLQEGNYPKALEVFKKLLDIAPGEIMEVIKRLSEYKEKSPEVMFHLAKLHKDCGDIQTALRVFGELFKVNKAYADLLVEQLKEIISKNSNIGEAYLLLSEVFIFKEEYDSALNILNQAEPLFPEKKEEVILKMGQIFFEKGEPEKALQMYNRLLNEVSDRRRVYRIITKTKGEYLKEKLEKIKGEGAGDRLNRANIYLLMGEINLAEKELEFIPTEEEIKKEYLILKTKIHLARNRPLDALEVIRTLPADADTAPVYADCYEMIGSYEAAASVLRSVDATRWKDRIIRCEKLAQEKRLGRTGYFIEGRL